MTATSWPATFDRSKCVHTACVVVETRNLHMTILQLTVRPRSGSNPKISETRHMTADGFRRYRNAFMFACYLLGPAADLSNVLFLLQDYSYIEAPQNF